MSLSRRLAGIVCAAQIAFLPPRLRRWGEALRCEVAAIEDDRAALLFALAGLNGLGWRGIAFHLVQPFASGDSPMTFDDAASRPRATGIACAIGAVLLGLTYLAIADAPARFLALNAVALAIGLILLPAIRWSGAERWPGAAMLAGAGALLATALLGQAANGAVRWVSVAGLAVQPSLILLPAMIVAHARTRLPTAGAALAIAAIALALQPDRAMAGVLAAGAGAVALARPGWSERLVAVMAAAAFAVTLALPDALPASPFVDQVLWSAFAVHPVAGLAVYGGAALLLLPALLLARGESAHRAVGLAFGATWGAALLAAALGNYPTPVVGYGGSAVLGYLLSLALLPLASRALPIAGHAPAGEAAVAGPDLRVAAAWAQRAAVPGGGAGTSALAAMKSSTALPLGVSGVTMSKWLASPGSK